MSAEREDQGQQAETASVPDHGHAGAETFVEDDPTSGKEVFTSICATCHGVEGTGAFGRFGERLGADLTTSDFVATTTDLALVVFLETGRPDKGMPSWAHLGRTRLADAVAYVRTLQEE